MSSPSRVPGDRTRCGMCGQFRARATTHRCPAPALVVCSPAATRVTEADGSITSRGHAAAGVDRARRLLARMGAPHRMHYLVGPLIAEHMTCAGTTEPTPAAVRRLTRRLSGPKGTGPTLTQWAAVVAADNAGRGTGSRPSPADAWVSAAADLGEGVAPRAGLLTGDHLIAAGMPPGPQFRPLLAAALAAQDEGSFGDERGALAWLAAQE